MIFFFGGVWVGGGLVFRVNPNMKRVAKRLQSWWSEVGQ